MTPTTQPSASQKPSTERVPLLRNGDHLTREEFERRYAAMPQVKKAELIEGVVRMPSPVSSDHSEPHFDFITWLGTYRTYTPGVVGGDNGTIRLDLGNEPQPDAYLRILESHGGQAKIDEDGYVTHAPELVAEVSVSRVSVDLHEKLEAYQRNGAREYIVWRVEDAEIDWFVLRDGQFVRLPPTQAGQYRSEVLPGLWLDPAPLVAGNLLAMFQVLQQGLASPEHAAFVAQLRQKAGTQ